MIESVLSLATLENQPTLVDGEVTFECDIGVPIQDNVMNFEDLDDVYHIQVEDDIFHQQNADIHVISDDQEDEVNDDIGDVMDGNDEVIENVENHELPLDVKK